MFLIRQAVFRLAPLYTFCPGRVAVPETKKVKSAEEVVPQTVSLLDREDLKQRGFDGSKLTNKELAEIAAKMNDYYLDYGFWDNMQEACIQLGIPRLKEKEK